MPAVLLEESKVLFAKLETVPGIDAAPTVTDAILCRTLDCSPIETTMIDRTAVTGNFGADDQIVAETFMTVDVEIELAAGGNSSGVPVPGIPPQWDALMQACSMQRTVTSSNASANAQGGGANYIQLDTGASAVDDFYSGMTILATSESGAARAPAVAGDRTTIKLAASFGELVGSTVGTSTTTVINLSAAASTVDDYYIGMNLVIAGQTRIITASDGTAKTATVSVAFPSAPAAATAFVIEHPSNYFQNHTIKVVHFGVGVGTDAQTKIVNTGSKPSTTKRIYLPSSVNVNVNFLELTVTTGSVTERRRIETYDVVSRLATFSKPLTVAPTVNTTFDISSFSNIAGFNGSTREVTFNSPIRIAPIATTPYFIYVQRLVIDYIGATKTAIVTPAFKNSFLPKSGTPFTINANVKYQPLTSIASQKTLTMYFFYDSILHVMTYAKGDMTEMAFKAGQLATAKFKFTGIVGKYENQVPGKPDLSAYIDPLPVNNANTKNVILAGYEDIIASEMVINLGNTVKHRDMPNMEDVQVLGRKSKGSIKWQAIDPDSFNYLEAVQKGVPKQLSFTHGPIGNQISVFAPRAFMSNFKYTGQDGIAFNSADLTLAPQKAGNNELFVILQ